MAVPEPLQEIVDNFALFEGRDKLHYLSDLSKQLPALPERLAAQRDQMEQVHECMTPVFVHAEREDGRVQLYFDVPRESPTVRGYAEILRRGLSGSTPEEILAVPDDFFFSSGLQDVISPQRTRGVEGMLRHVKRLAREQMAAGNGTPEAGGP